MAGYRGRSVFFTCSFIYFLGKCMNEKTIYAGGVTTDHPGYQFHRNHRCPGSQSVARRRFFAFADRAATARGSVIEGRS